MDDLKDINRLEETAEYLKVTPLVLTRMARDRKIGFLPAGRKKTFPRHVIETYVREKTVTQLADHPSGLAPSSVRRVTAGKA